MEPKATYDGICPLLVQGAVQRTQCDDIPGSYSPVHHVWMVETPQGPRPIVNAQPSLAELASKTDSVRERDDPGDLALLEMATKTKAELERDDQDFNLQALELATKTFTVRETDDQ